MFQNRGGAGRRGRRNIFGTAFRIGKRSEGQRGRCAGLQSCKDCVFQLLIGVDTEFYAAVGDGLLGVFAQIETGERNGRRAAPPARAGIALQVLLDFLAGGHQSEAARPAECEIEGNEVIGAPKVGIPALMSADEKHAIARVTDYVAVIADVQGEFLFGARRMGKNDQQRILAARSQILLAQILVLKIGERLARGVGNLFDLEKAHQLHHEDALAHRAGADAKRCLCVKAHIRPDGGIDGAGDGGEVAAHVSMRIRGWQGGPHVIEALALRLPLLADQHRFLATRVNKHIHRAHIIAPYARIKIGLRRGGEQIHHHA